MTRPEVALVESRSAPESLREAIELCDGFRGLKHDDRVFIKPNIVTYGRRYFIAPYGVLTTTSMVRSMVEALKDYGCGKITIGEGVVSMEKGVGTAEAFRGLGYEALAKRYGVDLVDFNKSESIDISLYDDFSVPVAREALDTDFFIDLPTLKTHGSTRVSLGIKNLKGVLKLAGKKACHEPQRPLDVKFPILAEKIPVPLTVIDGTYMLEKGPLHFGRAYRKNLIIASRDILGADIAGAAVMGIAAADVGHLSFFSSRTARPIDIGSYALKGIPLDSVVQPIETDEAWNETGTGPMVFDKRGICGIAVRKHDETTCSGCSMLLPMCNLLTVSAFKGVPFDGVEVLNGKKMQASPGFNHTILAGRCICRVNANNTNIRHAIEVKSCPPQLHELVRAFGEAGMTVDPTVYELFMARQGSKYDGKPEFDPSHFRLE